MRVPSGDHTGDPSGPGSNVRRDWTFRAMSMIQMSRLPGFPVPSATATRRSSGDSARLTYGAGVAHRAERAAGAVEPRQLHAPPGRRRGAYTSVPFSDTDAPT